MRIAQEEIFGPVLCVIPFETDDEAVAIANDSIYGLAGGVQSGNLERARSIANRMRTGTVWINDHNKLFAEAETGGYRRSGLGRLHGVDALVDFTEIKHIYQNVGVVGA